MKPHRITRRAFMGALAASAAGCATVADYRRSRAEGLLEIAGAYVELAEEDRLRHRLWGRIGGSATERGAARLLCKQLTLRLPEPAWLEPVQFSAHRPREWSLKMEGHAALASAVPTPFDARFPTGSRIAPLAHVRTEQDWEGARDKWAFVQAEMDVSPSRNSVREGLLYERAVRAGAKGFVFSLPMPRGRWSCVVPIDKPFALRDERYPDGERPIPCFYVDAEDGSRLARAAALHRALRVEIDYQGQVRQQGFNAVARLAGAGSGAVAILAHLDSFFSGANDNASGLATLVALAGRLGMSLQIPPGAEIYFIGLSAHHDAAAGLRAFVDADAARWASIDRVIQLEHTDAQWGLEGAEAGWPERLNDRRAAYLGPRGWPEIAEALPALVRESGVMTVDPSILERCIGDQHVICGEKRNFCLIQGTPYYHTNHDTIDKLSEAGLAAGVDFHLRLLEVIGAVSARPGAA